MLAAVFPAVLFLSGCGYVGDPLPPLANIPGHITGLTAVQRGRRILIEFQVPTETTEGVAIRGPLRRDLRIGGPSAGGFNEADWAARAKQVSGGTVTNGIAHYEAPSAEWTGQDVTIAARVIGSNGKASAWSNFVNLAVVAPPETPATLKVDNTPRGVHLSWPGPAGDFRIFRRADNEKDFAPVAEAQQLEWTDPNTEYGQHYSYRVQRIVKKDGRVDAESEPSPAAEITPRDVFQPAVPAGLRALAAASSIELSWEPDTEPDLAGYRVYRSVDGGAFEKTADVSLPAYSDQKVEHGKTYRYAVTAVDRSGNESARSAAVEATL